MPNSIPDGSLLVQLLGEVRNDMRDMRAETRESFGQMHTRLERIEDANERHARDDEQGFLLVRGEVADVRDEHARTAQKVAEIIGERKVEAKVEAAFNASGTGRFNVVPERGSGPQMGGGGMFIPTPPAGVPIELKYGKHDSKPPAVVKWLSKSIGKLVEGTAGKLVFGSLATLSAGLCGAYFHAAVVPPVTHIVQVSASPPPVVIPPPVEILPAAAFVQQVVDAGASPAAASSRRAR